MNALKVLDQLEPEEFEKVYEQVLAEDSDKFRKSIEKNYPKLYKSILDIGIRHHTDFMGHAGSEEDLGYYMEGIYTVLRILQLTDKE